MTIVVEYRIPMPFSAAEYQIGQLYTIAKKSKLESAGHDKSGGAGVKIITNKPYSGGFNGSGQYTNKVYYLANRLPDWVKKLLPSSAAKLREEAWNSYPKSRNRFTNPLLDKLQFEIESVYLDGPPIRDNVFELDKKDVANRCIKLIDLTNDNFKTNKSQSGASSKSSTFANSQDVLEFNPLFREPLSKSWLEEHEFSYAGVSSSSSELDDEEVDVNSEKLRGAANQSMNDSKLLSRQLMTCYKLVRVSCPIWPVQNKVEQFIQSYCCDTMIESHRLTWLWQDEWTGMSLEEIRAMESQTQRDLMVLMPQESFN